MAGVSRISSSGWRVMRKLIGGVWKILRDRCCVCCCPDASSPCVDDTATVDEMSSTVDYFCGGASITAGRYRVCYVEGALGIAQSPPEPPENPYNSKWLINAFALSGIGCFISHSGGSTDINAPGAPNDFYDTQAECETANAGKCVCFDHAGGTIGVYFFDYNWPDNFPGSPNPTFRLELCDDGV